MHGGLTRRFALLAVLAVVFTAAFAQGASASGGQNPRAGDPNPLVGQIWWNQYTKWNPTWRAFYSLRRRGRREDAYKALLLALSPQFRWWGRWERPIRTKLRKTIRVLRGQNRSYVPLIAVFGHEGSGCSPTYQGGGPAGDAAYRRWIRAFARGIGRQEAVLAFEPDALGTIGCLARSRRGARLRTLAYGVKVLSRLPNATVYIDAGAADWKSVPVMARMLRAVGVRRVRGFVLNSTHHVTTKRSIAYGRRLSRRVGGKHFVVNTSHNGNGLDMSLPPRRRWCNPPNGAAGALPTTKTAHPKVDAYMWVERPGYSNGPCNGGPKAGAWWEKRALQLVERSSWYKAIVRGR